MPQHFLLSAQARSLSLKKLNGLSEDQAFALFRELRWGKGEETVCPRCGARDRHYVIRGRRQWRCKACDHTFSVTSGTIFAHHKLPLKVYLIAIGLFTNAVKGISALQLARDLDVQYKTAFVLAHKIRESLMEHRDVTPLAGEVHVDGAYVNYHVRPKNKKVDRVDRRLAKNQRKDKRCVLVMRQKCQEMAEVRLGEPQEGSSRTLAFVIKQENQEDVTALAGAFITPGSVVCADESNAYDPLHGQYDTRRVNHQQEYRADDGTTNNLAESYFSRFRRMQYGQTHKFGNLYLVNYANEVAYREDTRRWANGRIFEDIARKCAKTRTNRDWCGYWQGNKRNEERLAA